MLSMKKSWYGIRYVGSQFRVTELLGNLNKQAEKGIQFQPDSFQRENCKTNKGGTRDNSTCHIGSDTGTLHSCRYRAIQAPSSAVFYPAVTEFEPLDKRRWIRGEGNRRIGDTRVGHAILHPCMEISK